MSLTCYYYIENGRVSDPNKTEEMSIDYVVTFFQASESFILPFFLHCLTSIYVKKKVFKYLYFTLH